MYRSATLYSWTLTWIRYFTRIWRRLTRRLNRNSIKKDRETTRIVKDGKISRGKKEWAHLRWISPGFTRSPQNWRNIGGHSSAHSPISNPPLCPFSCRGERHSESTRVFSRFPLVPRVDDRAEKRRQCILERREMLRSVPRLDLSPNPAYQI